MWDMEISNPKCRQGYFSSYKSFGSVEVGLLKNPIQYLCGTLFIQICSFFEKFFSSIYIWVGWGAITKLGRKILRFIYYLERVGTDYLFFLKNDITYYRYGVSAYEKYEL